MENRFMKVEKQEPLEKKKNTRKIVVTAAVVIFLVSLVLSLLGAALPGEQQEQVVRELYWSLPFYLCLCLILVLVAAASFGLAAVRKKAPARQRVGMGVLGLFLLGLAAFCLWYSVVNPLLDLPYVKDPAVIQLKNVYFERSTGYNSHSGIIQDSYYLTGETSQGQEYRFPINQADFEQGQSDWQKTYENYNADFQMVVQVECLPHTRTLLSWEY